MKRRAIQSSINNGKQTDRLAVYKLEDFSGPDDEYDGSCGHKVNTGLILMSVNNMQMIRNLPPVKAKLEIE